MNKINLFKHLLPSLQVGVGGRILSSSLLGRISVGLLFALFGTYTASAQEAYAVYTASNSTLTFYYDNLRDTRDGTDFNLNEDYHVDAGWQEYIDTEDVTTVVFDPSFADARPTTTYSWFYGMTNLTTITGMENLNTSEVFDMAYMFQNCYALTSLDLSNFDTSKVTDMEGMFANGNNLTTLDLSSFNTANVVNMKRMFADREYLTTIYVGEGWSTAKVTSSDGMFSSCLDIEGGNGTRYSNDHLDASYAHIDVAGNPGYFTEAPTEPYAVVSTDGKTMTFYYDNMKGQHPGTKYKVPNGAYAPDWYWNNASPNVETVVFDPSFAGVSPNYTYCWFKEMYKLSTITGLEYLNTSEVTNMAMMFMDCGSLTSLNLNGFDTKNVTNMEAMFRFCGSLVTIEVGDKWSIANVDRSDLMFEDCSSLRGGNGTTYDADHVNKEYARIDGGPDSDTPGYFTGSSTLPDGEAYAVYTEENTTLTFYYDNQRNTRTGTTYDLNTGNNDAGWKSDGTNASVTKVVFDPSFAYARPTSMYAWFYYMENLTTITGISNLNTSEVTNMAYMFNLCSSLTSIDLSNFHTSKVTDMAGMFTGCISLTTLDVSSFNTANVTNMYYMFDNCSSLTTLDVSNFNTAKVTNMSYMFSNCYDLTTIYVGTGWNTEKVTSHNKMFYQSNSLVGGNGTTYDANHVNKEYARVDGTGNPGYFTDKNARQAYAVYTADNTTLTFYYDNLRNTRTGTSYYLNTGSNYPGWSSDETEASVTNVVFDPSFADARPTSTLHWFGGMGNLTTITGIEYLNTSEVTDMRYMFDQCGNLTTLDVSSFNTANVTNMAYMFRYCSNLKSLDVSSFNTENVTNMAYMFFDCEKLTSLVVSSFNTENVTDMSHMFSNCRELTSLDLSSFNTANVTDMTYMFASCWDLASLDVSSFNTENVTDMRSMFAGCTLLTSLDVSSFNTEKVTNMHGMFYFCSSLPPLDVSSFNTANVTDMGSMFGQCDRLTTLDLSSFNTAKVTDMSNMFYGCYALTTICVGTGWNTDAVSTSEYMFYRCSNLMGGKGTTYDENHIDKDYARIDGGPDNPGYLTGAPYLVLNGTTLTFYHDGDFNKEGTAYNLIDWSLREEGIGTGVTTVVFDPSFAGARPTKTYLWFYKMQNLTSITGIEYLNTSEVTNMSGMFYNCSSLTSLDVSRFDTEKVTDMRYMFSGCSSLSSLDLSSFSTAKVTDMSGMFYYCSSLTSLDLSGFNTANATDMSYMFLECSSLTSLDLSSFNTANATNMSGMFYNCYSLTSLDLSSFNTSNVTDMSYMFCECSNLTSLDLSRFNTAKVTDMKYMFCWCEALTTIYVSEGWSTAPGVESDYMFAACTALKGGNGTKFNSNHIDKEYARIDGGATRPGYFTYKASFMLGDVNGDNKVDVADITALTNHLLGIEGAYNSIAADVDGNGEVTSADVPVLVSIILGR